MGGFDGSGTHCGELPEPLAASSREINHEVLTNPMVFPSDLSVDKRQLCPDKDPFQKSQNHDVEAQSGRRSEASPCFRFQEKLSGIIIAGKFNMVENLKQKLANRTFGRLGPGLLSLLGLNRRRPVADVSPTAVVSHEASVENLLGLREQIKIGGPFLHPWKTVDLCSWWPDRDR